MAHIFVISHKQFPVTLEKPFFPMFVGAESKVTTQDNFCDNRGDNISDLNPYFCELTGLYYVWKNWMPNLNSDEQVGFCHYRRFFSLDKKVEHLAEGGDWEIDKILSLLLNSQYDVILPEQISFPIRQHWFSHSKRLNKFKFPWQKLSLLEQYGLELNFSDIQCAIDLLPDPHKLDFEKYLQSKQFAPYNMFITSVINAKSYFEILFPWLFEVQKVIEFESRNTYQSRVFGFIAERFCSYYFNSYHQPVFVPVSFIIN